MALETLKTLSSTSPRSKWTLLFIILVGGFLRIYKLDYESLWYDELHSIIPTAPDKSISSIIEYCKSDQPPFFFLYLHFFFKIFGYGEWTGRVASALVGIAAIPAVFALGREIHNSKTGLFAAWLTAINYFHIYYSQELRFYGMAFLLTTLSFYFALRMASKNQIIDFILYAFCTSALLYTHYYGMIIFATQVAILAVVYVLPKKNETSFFYRSLVAGGVVAISFLPWLPTVFQDSEIKDFWIPEPKLTFLLNYLFDYFGKDEICTSALGVLALFFLVESFKPQNRFNISVWILVVWISLSYTLPFLWSVIFTPMLHIRYTIVTLPAVLLVFAFGWDSLHQINARLALVFAFVITLSTIVNLFPVREFYSTVEKGQFRESSALVIAKNVSNYTVFSSVSWHYNFYFRNEQTKTNPLQLTPQSFPDNFWVLQAQNTEFGMKQEIDQIVKFGYSIIESHEFHQARAVFFQRKEFARTGTR